VRQECAVAEAQVESRDQAAVAPDPAVGKAATESLTGPRKDVAGRVESTTAHRERARMVMPQPSSTAEMPRGSVTGGTTPPNGESAELMYFEHTGVNPFVATEEDALSTFAVDVDDASWAVARNYLEHDDLPPAAAVRVEEFVNAFDPGWPGHAGDDLRVHVAGAPSRFGRGYELLRIGITGRDLPKEARRAANLVFVVDVSGSMGRENRLGAVRHCLTMLLDELQEGDRVGIVVYGSRGEVRLQPTDIERRGTIQAAIDGLVPNGSTNAYEGLKLAYEMARTHYEADKINRLILCSDGVANNGATTVAEEMLALVRRSSDEGISLSTIGFGMGNYNDVLMEKLADKGDGNYAYVDRREEAERVFRENLTGMLETVAREAKVQVEFDGRYVSRWRLLGYENRDVADRDFRNDAVDAGEIGAGHRVTALYEIKLTDEGRGTEHDLGVVRLRWEAPRHDVKRAGEVTEIAAPIPRAAFFDRFGDAAPRLRLQATVAEFAEILRGSYWAKDSTYEDVLAVVEGLAATEAGDGDAAEVARLVRAAARLQAAKEARERPGGSED
jgi:Ca-activated chloride channel family protein